MPRPPSRAVLPAIIGGLLTAGLRLDFLHEHETVPWAYLSLARRPTGPAALVFHRRDEALGKPLPMPCILGGAAHNVTLLKWVKTQCLWL